MAPPTLTQAAPAAPHLDTPKMLVGEHTLPASWWTSESIFELEKGQFSTNPGCFAPTHPFR